MYCAVAWRRFFSAADYVQLDSFLRRCVKLGYVGPSSTVADMFLEADDALFHNILYNKVRMLTSLDRDESQKKFSGSRKKFLDEKFLHLKLKFALEQMWTLKCL